jgi:alpha-glucuronidase
MLVPLLAAASLCEDGSKLWLRWTPAVKTASVRANHNSTVTKTAIKELQTYWRGGPVTLSLSADARLAALGAEGYAITGSAGAGITVESAGDAGLLYGAFHLLRLQGAGDLPAELALTESPKYALRILDHWDNLDGTVTRGYAGHSIWKWAELPAQLSPRYEQYARANAAVGINGACLNNVNADPKVLQPAYLAKVKAIADALRPYHIRVFLAVNFASPSRVGGLATSDPLSAAVRQWWAAKADEIYKLVPDFGGFLVKAASEGEPGPGDYGRTHVDGANALADALAPHGGVLMWRAFVYANSDTDRAKQAYAEFMPYDGKFAKNVVLQVKNGPVDFQPREPFHPLFGGMQKTAVMVEFQITQEYLGQMNHSVFLPVLQKEVLMSDTYAKGAGSTVARATDGSLFGHAPSAIAGVANIGENANWCGHHFAQANWFGFGRLAWNYELDPADIAKEWLKLTFSTAPEFVAPVAGMMLRTREACVDYMTPLGLHHIMAYNHHYGPEPWCDIAGVRKDWLPPYFHKAAADGIGFDRSSKGSNAVAQYFSPLREKLNDVATCDERVLLWFHHVPWTFVMKSGRTLWAELAAHYQHGVEEARDFQKIWDRAQSYVDAERFEAVQKKMKVQTLDAIWWRDACMLYFQTFSKTPIPFDLERTVYNLDDLKKIHLPGTDHN